ncbi:MAG TPA: ABC transporter ATP-binding protein [Thermodesulfobacteriota bacterium]|nr:ABC transporter ATP-binding protein [Thermodesulfobacteriota bacterium]
MAYFRVEKLVKKFGGLTAVNGVTFGVEKGEIFGLIGPNGSGKTTTFNMISGVYPPTSGKVVFRNREIQRMKSHRICHLGVGRTFQVVKPLGRMTVLDNVIAAAFSRVNSMQEARSAALRTLDFCGLSPVREALAKSLPIAGRKRLEIARAMATRPELLLLDETAAGLNPTELFEAIELIRKIRENGTTIIIIEHIMHVIMTISDRIHAINFGQTIAEGTPKEVAANPAVIEAYLGTDYA